MPERPEHELDVDFEVIEDPEDRIFPRLPNVISHRGHRVKIAAIVRDLPHPERPTEIRLRASVFVLNNAIMGEKGHVAHPFQLWGRAEEMTVPFPSEQHPRLPFEIEIFVPRNDEDDHLGEGPHYEALVEVRTTTIEPDVRRDSDAQTRTEAVNTNTTAPRTEGSFMIRFVAQ